MKMKRADLKHFMYVRTSRNDDRVMEFAELMQNGTVFPPILVAKSNIPEINDAIIDGRHREGAYEMNDIHEVEVTTAVVSSVEEFISLAYKANSGGALPPSRVDTEHTVAMLIRLKVSKKNITEHLGLPITIAGRYIESVKSRVRRANMIQARAAVASGTTIVEAAEKNDVPIDDLKAELSGRRRKTSDIAEKQRQLTTNYRSVGQKTAALMRDLRDKLEEGDVSLKQTKGIVDHVRKLLKSGTKAVDDWGKRFDAMSKVGK